MLQRVPSPSPSLSHPLMLRSDPAVFLASAVFCPSATPSQTGPPGPEWWGGRGWGGGMTDGQRGVPNQDQVLILGTWGWPRLSLLGDPMRLLSLPQLLGPTWPYLCSALASISPGQPVVYLQPPASPDEVLFLVAPAHDNADSSSAGTYRAL